MAAQRKTRRSSTTVKHVLVRGSRRNPVPMIATRRKGTLKRLARLLQTHFPGAKIPGAEGEAEIAMDWFGKYVVERNGLVNWREGMLVVDEGLDEACSKSPLVQFVVETSAVVGVKVGQA